MLMIPVDVNSTIPLYLQIADHITSLTRSGQLAPGARLPASRMLADQLQIHRSTVVNAYDELKARGVIDAQQGSGSYIAETVRDFALAQRPPLPMPSMNQPEGLISDLWKLTQAEGMISLSMGMPDVSLMPVDAFEDARSRVLRRDRGLAYNYEEPQGYYPLRKAIAANLARHGIVVDAEDVIITWGALEAVSLAARAFTTSGDWALIEEPSYFSMLFNLRRLGLHLVGFGLDESGPDWHWLGTRLETMLNATVDPGEDDPLWPRPRFVCVVPDHHNPTGIRWAMTERHRFMRLMSQLAIPVIEDSTYRDLTYDGPTHLPLRALDNEVMYCGSFSKALMPGLRIGYLVAHGRTRDQLITLKTVSSGSGESLSQRTLAEYLTTGEYDAHMERTVDVYRRRRDAMLEAMDTFFPSEVVWTRPSGGFFSWVTLPDCIPIERFFYEALERGVAVAPSSVFYPPMSSGTASSNSINAFRLAFSRYPEATLVHAIRVLGNLMKSMLR